MAVSAPPTPAHLDRPMNLQSESLAWLDNATLRDNGKENLIDVPNNTQYDNTVTHELYQTPDVIINGTGDTTQYFNAEGITIFISEKSYTYLLIIV